MQTLRIVFMGTPDFAVPCLQTLLDSPHSVVGVFTQPDKPQGRKMVLTPPPVKVLAAENGVPVFQPEKMKDPATLEQLKILAPDLIVVVAYGCILPKSVLEAPKHGCINLHVSLLPKYRGSAPVQWAVLNGDTETGMAMLKFDNGTVAFLHVGRTAPHGYHTETEIVGTEAHIRVAGVPWKDRVMVYDQYGARQEIIENFPQRFAEAYLLEMVDFIDCIQKGRKPELTVYDGTKATLVTYAITDSFHTGKPVTVKY